MSEVREKVVEAFNKRYISSSTIICDDGEVIPFNSNWIVDSEYMNYVHDNEPSKRIQDFIVNIYIYEN